MDYGGTLKINDAAMLQIETDNWVTRYMIVPTVLMHYFT